MLTQKTLNGGAQYITGGGIHDHDGARVVMQDDAATANQLRLKEEEYYAMGGPHVLFFCTTAASGFILDSAGTTVESSSGNEVIKVYRTQSGFDFRKLPLNTSRSFESTTRGDTIANLQPAAPDDDECDCTPPLYELDPCPLSADKTPVHTNTDLSASVAQWVSISGDSRCFFVRDNPLPGPQTPQDVTVTGTYASCSECEQPPTYETNFIESYVRFGNGGVNDYNGPEPGFFQQNSPSSWPDAWKDAYVKAFVGGISAYWYTSTTTQGTSELGYYSFSGNHPVMSAEQWDLDIPVDEEPIEIEINISIRFSDDSPVAGLQLNQKRISLFYRASSDPDDGTWELFPDDLVAGVGLFPPETIKNYTINLFRHPTNTNQWKLGQNGTYRTVTWLTRANMNASTQHPCVGILLQFVLGAGGGFYENRITRFDLKVTTQKV